jgi:phage/plasmid-associated DNA primase
MEMKLHALLEQYRIKKGEPFTHTTKVPSGSYYIGEDAYEGFMTEYCNAIRKGVRPTVTERPGAYSPLRVDFDLKSSLDVGLKRQYTFDVLKKIIGFYQDELRSVIKKTDFENKMLYCVILEKKAPRVEEGKVKDGFHLHFPNFSCEPWMQDEYLRSRVIEKMIDGKIWSGSFLEPADKFIDTNMARKPWLMYGSAKKQGAEPFLATKVLDENLEEITLLELFQDMMKDASGKPRKCVIEYYLPRFLSVRRYDTCTPLKEEIEARRAAYGKKKSQKKIIVKKRSMDEVLEDIKIIKDGEIMAMLSDDRAETFDTWMDVGWTLFNIGQGCDEALDLWIEFSKRSDKFVEGECEDRWGKMEMRDKTIGSLLAMARADNPDSYKEWKDANVKTYLYKSLIESKPNEWDVGQVVYKLYKDRFLCADSKKDLWYEFYNHKWQYMDDGVTIRKYLATEVVELYYVLKAEIANEAAKASGDDTKRAKLESQAKKCEKIITALKTVPFQNNVMRMCKINFHDPFFLRKLDENKQLWVCENGVLDLELLIFRDGRPDDYMSFSCNLPYHKYEKNDDERIELKDFIRKVFTNKNRRGYFKDISCAAMEGGNINKQFVIGTGGGDNAKTITFNLLETTFGEYCMKFPRQSLLKGQSATASSAKPELARVRGKRMVVAQEVRKDETLDIGNIKEWTGNDSFFARGLYEKGTDIKPMFTLFMQCLCEGTLVGLPECGPIPIEKLENNQYVLAWDPETGGIVRARQIRFLNQGIRQCITITLLDATEITCTLDHRFLTHEGIWIQAQNIIPGRTMLMSVGCTARRTYPSLVVKVVDAGKRQVYDLTIERPYSNFIAGGLVSHNCNEPPSIPGHDDATWNRVRLLDYDSKFVLPKDLYKCPVPDSEEEQFKMRRFKADPSFGKRLPSMAPVMLSYLFERFKKYKKRGIREPPEVQMATNMYRSMNDVYLQFIQDRLEQITYPKGTEEKDMEFLKLTDLHPEFMAWYHETYQGYTREKFNKVILKHEFNKKLQNFGKKNRAEGWYGYRFVMDEPDDENQAKIQKALSAKSKDKPKKEAKDQEAPKKSKEPEEKKVVKKATSKSSASTTSKKLKDQVAKSQVAKIKDSSGIKVKAAPKEASAKAKAKKVA